MAETPTGGHSAPLTVVHHRLGEADYTSNLPADGATAIEVSDIALLFSGQYLRQDSDLVISGEGRSILIENYFGSEHPALLVAPNGARIDGATVNALTGPIGPGQYAQAGATQNLIEIGKVVTLEGTASSQHTDGVKDELAIGSAVYQGDVVETGADTKLGISFIDRTLFSLSANARMVLDEVIFNPAEPANNSMVMNLVQGAFVFVTGEIAPTGSMQVQTPIATMGIRGTTPKVVVDADMGITEFAILPDPDTGNVGSYVLVNRATGEVMGRVDSAADKWVVSSLSGEAVKIGKTGNDLLEDEAALDEIRELFSRAFGDRTDLDAARPPAQIALATDNGGQQDGNGEGDGGDTGGTDGTPPSGAPDDPPIAGDDSFNIIENGYLSAPGGTPVPQLENIIYVGGNSVSVASPSVIDGSIGGKDIDPDGFSFAVTQVNGATLPFINGEARVQLPSGAFLEVQPNGQIDYFDNQVYEYLAKDEIATETFTYTITDLYGKTDTATVTITITGTNDTPDITVVDVTGAIQDIGEEATVPPQTNAGLLVDAGSITFNDLDLTDLPVATEQMKSISAVRQDNSVLVLTPDQIAAIYAAFSIKTVGPQTNSGEIGWDYQINEADLDFLGAGEVVTVVFTITVTDDSGQLAAAGPNEINRATQDVTITISGASVDAPVISVINTDNVTVGAAGDFKESPDLGEGTPDAGLIVSGTVTVSDVDTTDIVTLSVISVQVNGTLGGAADVGTAPTDPAQDISNATLLSFLKLSDTDNDAAGPDTAAGPSASIVVLSDGENVDKATWTFDSGNEAFDYLADGEQLTLVYRLQASDGKGGFDNQNVFITITGTNDRPQITVGPADADTVPSDTTAPDTALGFYESADQGEGVADAGLTVSGTLTVADADVTDVVTAAVVSVKVNTVAGGDADTGAPVGVAPLDIPNATLLSFLTLSDTDNDAAGPDTAAGSGASIVVLSNGETLDTLNWTFDSGTEAFDYLADGETLELEYTVSLTDDSGTANDADTQVIKITITGTNDRPQITVGPADADTVPSDTTAPDTALGFYESADQGEGVADAGLTVSGTLTVADADVTDVVTAAVVSVKVNTVAGGDADTGAPVGVAPLDIPNATLLSFLTLSDTDNDAAGPDTAAGSGASIVVLSNGETLDTLNWTFDSGTEAFDYLADGETLELEYTVSLTDDSGTANDADTQVIKITITGTNDRPQITVGPADADTVPSDTTAPDTALGFYESADQGEGVADAGLTVSGTLTVADADVTDVVTAAVVSVKVNTVAGGDADTGAPVGVAPLDIPNATLLSFLTLSDTDNDAAGPDTAAGSGASIVVLSNGETLDTLNWTFDSGTEAFDYLADGETLELEYTVSLTDDSGTANDADTQVIKITITGTNDRPQITVGPADADTVPSDTTAPDTALGFYESADQGEGVADAGLTVSGTLTVADADVTDVVTAAVVSVKVNTVAGGDADTGAPVGVAPLDIPNATLLSFLTLSDTDNDAAGPDTAAGSGASIVVLSNGETLDTLNWTFDSGTEAFDYLADGETLELEYTVSLTDDSGTANDADTQVIKITITGTNDRPQITVGPADADTVPSDTTAPDTALGFYESADQGEGVADAGLTVSGTLTVADADVTDVVTAAVVSVKVNTVAGGDADTGAPVGVAPLDIPNATLLSFLTLSDTDNDAAGPDTAAGSGASIVVLSNGETLDTLNWTFDSGTEAFDYLADGETLELEYTVSLTDDSGTANDADTQVIKITITGTNDTPVITAGDVSETLAEAETAISTSGSFDVLDVDVTDVVTIDGVTVSTGGNDSGAPMDAALLAMFTATPASPAAVIDGTETTGTVDWSFNSGADQFDYLAVGEQLDLTYRVTVTDDNGATDYQDISITITGTNDAPTVAATGAAGFTEGVNASAQGLTDAGNITFDDVDASDVVDISAALSGVVEWSGGTIDPSLAAALEAGFTAGATDEAAPGTTPWAYSVSAVDLDFLGEGETIDFSFEITATDSEGAVATDTVDFTITGTNDAPVVNSVSVVGAEAGVGERVISGKLSFADLDINDTHEIVVGNPLVTWNGTGQPPVSDDPGELVFGTVNSATGSVDWTYTLADGALPGLGIGDTLTVASTIVVEDDSDAANAQSMEIPLSITFIGTDGEPYIAMQLDGKNYLFGTAGDDGLSEGIEYDFSGNDIIYGLGGADEIDGGGGNDIIASGDGSAILSGGDGLDRFVFELGETGVDEILDFDTQDDELDLSALLTGSFDPDNPENEISIIENGFGGAIVNVNGTDIATLDSIGENDSISVVYNNHDATVQVLVAGSGGV